jgi:hypothetical protein
VREDLLLSGRGVNNLKRRRLVAMVSMLRRLIIRPLILRMPTPASSLVARIILILSLALLISILLGERRG